MSRYTARQKPSAFLVAASAVGSGNTAAFYNFLLGVFLLLTYVMLTWTMAEVNDSGPDGGHMIPPRAGGLRQPVLPETGPAAPLVPPGTKLPFLS